MIMLKLAQTVPIVRMQQLFKLIEKTQMINVIKLLEIIDSLKIKNIVLCPDAQQVSDEDVTDSIGKQISLEQIMSQMNLKSDA